MPAEGGPPEGAVSDTVIDLSQVVETGMQIHPLHPATHVLPWASREVRGWATNTLFMSEHAGTHLDAPRHFFEGGRSVEELNLARLTGPAVALDVSSHWPRGLVKAADVEAALAGLELEEGDAVLLWTGTDRHHGTPAYLEDHPGISQGAATLLADRGVRLVGTDAPSIDHPEAEGFPAHHTLLPREVLIAENLAHLARVIARSEGRRFTLHTFPLRIRGGTGSPVRAVAVLDDR